MLAYANVFPHQGDTTGSSSSRCRRLFSAAPASLTAYQKTQCVSDRAPDPVSPCLRSQRYSVGKQGRQAAASADSCARSVLPADSNSLHGARLDGRARHQGNGKCLGLWVVLAIPGDRSYWVRRPDRSVIVLSSTLKLPTGALPVADRSLPENIGKNPLRNRRPQVTSR